MTISWGKFSDGKLCCGFTLDRHSELNLLGTVSEGRDFWGTAVWEVICWGQFSEGSFKGGNCLGRVFQGVIC